MGERMYDVVVVGGGAAGLSAALVLGRARRRVAVADAGAPRNAPAAHMQGFLSRDGMSPAELLAAGRAEVTGYGVELVDDQVVAIEAGFIVRLVGGDVLKARRILVATGVRDELPDIPGVRERWGRDLLHCPYCHGWEVRDQPIGVLGTVAGSVQHALLVRQWSDDVAFFVHRYDLTAAERLQLDGRGVQIVDGEIARLVVEHDRLTGVELTDGQLIARSAVFIRPGNVPHPDGLLTGLGCNVGEAGFVTVDATGRTSTFGVWAAGNVVDPRAQVITAAGAGSAAAIAINADLVQEDVERDVSAPTKGAPVMSIESPHAARPPSRALPALMSACVVVVVAMVAAINLALPKLSSSDLHPNSTGLLWIVDSYILVFGCLLILAGAIGDRLGRKGVLLTGLGLFTVGCLASAAAPSLAVLLIGRVVTGIGASLVMPATLSLLLQVTPLERKPHAIATWSAATGAAGALGTVGGGVILQWLPWQGLFLIIGSLAPLLAVAVARVAPRGQRHPVSLDLLGAGLLTGTVFALLFAIIEGADQGWSSALVLGSFGASLALLAAFVVHALRVTHPLLDPRVFAISKLRVGTLGVAAVFFGLFALFFVNAQYLQYAKGYSPLVTGLAILPLPIGMIIASRRSVAIAGRIGARSVVTGGMLLVAAGLAALSFVDSGTSYLPYALALLAISTGAGLSVPALSTGIITSLPPARAGMGSGLNSAAREIGAALGVAVVGTVLTSHFAGALPKALQDHADSTSQTLRTAEQLGGTVHTEAVNAFTGATGTGYLVVSGIVLIAAMAIAWGLRDRRPEVPEVLAAGGVG